MAAGTYGQVHLPLYLYISTCLSNRTLSISGRHCTDHAAARGRTRVEAARTRGYCALL